MHNTLLSVMVIVTFTVNGTLCFINYSHGHCDRFDVGGCEASSSLILEALTPQVLPERLERIQQVPVNKEYVSVSD